jgi:DNA-binding ferritin-like protein (Dps family)
MNFGVQIPEPLMFNPLKHYLPFIRDYIDNKTEAEKYPGSKAFIKELKHLGTCVMDIYTGELSPGKIFKEIADFLERNGISSREQYKKWAGTDFNNFRIIPLSDGSQWTLKYYEHETRYVHIFPARSSRYTFRVKANTLKSAILYQVLIGKDYVSEDDLNKTRGLAGLSPVKDVADTEAVTEMIEILRV